MKNLPTALATAAIVAGCESQPEGVPVERGRITIGTICPSDDQPIAVILLPGEIHERSVEELFGLCDARARMGLVSR